MPPTELFKQFFFLISYSIIGSTIFAGIGESWILPWLSCFLYSLRGNNQISGSPYCTDQYILYWITTKLWAPGYCGDGTRLLICLTNVATQQTQMIVILKMFTFCNAFSNVNLEWSICAFLLIFHFCSFATKMKNACFYFYFFEKDEVCIFFIFSLF